VTLSRNIILESANKTQEVSHKMVPDSLAETFILSYHRNKLTLYATQRAILIALLGILHAHTPNITV